MVWGGFFWPATSVIFDLSSFLKLYYTIQTIQRFVRFSVWKSPCLCKRATTLSLSNWMFAIVFSPIDSTKEMKQMCDRLLVIMCLKIQLKCGSFPSCVCADNTGSSLELGINYELIFYALMIHRSAVLSENGQP